MAYLPKNKYKVLYTDGTEFKLLSDGKPYTGNYIKLNDGRVLLDRDWETSHYKLI